MKFFTILPIAAAFFGSLVAGVPVESKSPSMSLDLGTFCTFCETLPARTRAACYAHCRTTTQNWVVLNDTVALNTTLKTLPVASKATLTSSMAASDFTADATGMCDFCDNFAGAGKLDKRCHKRCRKHMPTKAGNIQIKPWVINSFWNFCTDSCAAHGCTGPYQMQCFGSCLRCYDDLSPSPRSWELEEIDVQSFDPPDPLEPLSCFCPAVEYADRYEEDRERWEENYEVLSSDSEDEDGSSYVGSYEIVNVHS